MEVVGRVSIRDEILFQNGMDVSLWSSAKMSGTIVVIARRSKHSSGQRDKLLFSGITTALNPSGSPTGSLERFYTVYEGLSAGPNRVSEKVKHYAARLSELRWLYGGLFANVSGI
jgi:hypothetical protein